MQGFDRIIQRRRLMEIIPWVFSLFLFPIIPPIPRHLGHPSAENGIVNTASFPTRRRTFAVAEISSHRP